MPFLFRFLPVLVLLGTPFFSVVRAADDGPLDGIVLVIADGTSQELITATRVYAHGVKGRLALESFPQTAIVRTYSASDVVTDSSAAATAMARGIKADNVVVGMAHARSKVVAPSLLDLARKAGWSTGVVTDDSVTGATTSSFLVEHANRNHDVIIARKVAAQLGVRADIVLGGGAKWFADLAARPDVVYAPQERKAVAATAAQLAASGVATFQDWATFTAFAAAGGGDKPVLGLFFPKEFPYVGAENRALRLADLATAAVRFLRARNRPFFLVVEAALPDKASHLGQAKMAILEVLELDATLEALRAELPARTLIFVTTDHNTGGLALSGPPVHPRMRGDALFAPVPGGSGVGPLTWATGPEADPATANFRERIVAEPGKPMRTEREAKKTTDADYTQPAALHANSAKHTGGDVWLLADGPGSENVRGYLDNTDIFRLLAEALSRD